MKDENKAERVHTNCDDFQFKSHFKDTTFEISKKNLCMVLKTKREAKMHRKDTTLKITLHFIFCLILHIKTSAYMENHPSPLFWSQKEEGGISPRIYNISPNECSTAQTGSLMTAYLPSESKQIFVVQYIYII